ncbi:MAG TPA: hypothetical protein VNO55_18595, partial [Polyangia bacterium]|nr:hypothetical protein [Polyangia bacterium]
MSLVILLLALGGAPRAPPPAPPAPALTAIPFRTDAAPRIDPVFGDAATLRAAVDRFLALQGEMDRVRDEFSMAVHQALLSLPAADAGAAAAKPATGPRQCPAAVAEPYARALGAGGRFLTLGRQLQLRYREIRRGEDGGDSAGLTPDYRWKVRRAKEQYGHLLNDYREMRVAFHDQLGAELRHAACPTGSKAARRTPSAPIARASTGEGDPEEMDPNDPGAWTVEALDDPDQDPTRDPTRPPPPQLRSSAEGAAGAVVPEPPAPSPSAAPAVWIDVDNALCAQATHVTIDGQAMGDVEARGTASIRTRAGPHEVCVL